MRQNGGNEGLGCDMIVYALARMFFLIVKGALE
jgi:hypothetical protein